MFFKQYYLGCLSHASYLIGDETTDGPWWSIPSATSPPTSPMPRRPGSRSSGHLRGSVNVGLEGRFAGFAGDVISPDQSVALICEPGTERQARVRLSRIGFDRVEGYLRDPMLAFVNRPELVETN